MKRSDVVQFQGKQSTIAQLAIQLGLLAIRNKLRYGIQPVMTVYTMYADHPINEQVMVMVKVKTPDRFDLLELKTAEAVSEFIGGLEMVE